MFARAAPGDAVNLKQNSHFCRGLRYLLLSGLATETIRAKENQPWAIDFSYNLLFFFLPPSLCTCITCVLQVPTFCGERVCTLRARGPKGEQARSSSSKHRDPGGLKGEGIDLIKPKNTLNVLELGLGKNIIHLNTYQQQKQRCASRCVCSGNQLLKPGSVKRVIAAAWIPLTIALSAV